MSSVHISPLPAKVSVWVGGSLLKIEAEPGLRLRPSPAVVSKRGPICGFSKGSRKRLMRTLAKVKREVLPAFATLTYPDRFPDEPGQWKRDLDAFVKRLHRKFPGVGLIWRTEMKARKTGERAGDIAPHFHLLIWGLPALSAEFRAWLSASWFEVCGELDPKHLGAGTEIEEVRTFKRLLSYVSKYVAKVDQSPALHVGRWWGVRYASKIPWAALQEFAIRNRKAYAMIRALRRFIGCRKHFSLRTLSGICDASQWSRAFGIGSG